MPLRLRGIGVGNAFPAVRLVATAAHDCQLASTQAPIPAVQCPSVHGAKRKSESLAGRLLMVGAHRSASVIATVGITVTCGAAGQVLEAMLLPPLHIPGGRARRRSGDGYWAGSSLSTRCGTVERSSMSSASSMGNTITRALGEVAILRDAVAILRDATHAGARLHVFTWASPRFSCRLLQVCA